MLPYCLVYIDRQYQLKEPPWAKLQLSFLANNLSGALGPSLGMFLINHFSFNFFFLVCLGLSLCSLFITYMLGRRQVAPLEDSSIEDSLFLSRKAIPPSIIGFFVLFIWGALTAFFPLYAINHGVANPGLFFTTVAIILILGRGLGGKILDLYSKERIILPCLFTYIISMIILAFSKTLPMFILVAVIWGIGHTFLLPTLVVYALDRAGSSPGPAMGTYYAIADLGYSLGPVIMGILTNCVIKNVTQSMIEKGSLTHNRCYPIKGAKRRADYESTIKKRICRSHFFTVQKSVT